MSDAQIDIAYLDSRDTDTHVRSLYHADIVCAITDGEKRSLSASLDQLDDQGFLQR